MITKIRTQEQYQQVIGIIETYLAKATSNGGFNSLTDEENKELKHLSELAERYEDEGMKIMPVVPTISNLIQQKLKEKNLTQKALASMFAMSTAKISQILSGKRQPDVEFLKATHEKLGVDGNLLLKIL